MGGAVDRPEAAGGDLGVDTEALVEQGSQQRIATSDDGPFLAVVVLFRGRPHSSIVAGSSSADQPSWLELRRSAVQHWLCTGPRCWTMAGAAGQAVATNK